MSKKYTKKQICEAIAHWQDVLESMDETGCKLMAAFQAVYPESLLYSKTLDFTPTKNDIDTIYEILNENIFANSLKQQEFMLLAEHEMADLYKELKFTGNPADYYAQYFPIMTRNKDSNGLPVVTKDIFVFNVSNCPVNLSFTISSVCHEMIHKFDIHRGALRKIMKDFFENGVPYEEHATDVWVEKSDFSNSCGLTVIPNGNGVLLDKLCELSAVRIKRFCDANRSIEEIDESLSGRLMRGESTAKAWKIDGDTYCVAFG